MADSENSGRVLNFSAGPSALPLSVLEQCRDDMLNFQGSGMSVMEMSHRSKIFGEIFAEAKNNLREILKVNTRSVQKSRSPEAQKFLCLEVFRNFLLTTVTRESFKTLVKFLCLLLYVQRKRTFFNSFYF